MLLENSSAGHYWAIAALLATIYFSRKIYVILTHPLRKFPGPLLNSISNLPYSYHFFVGRKDFVILDLHARYGPVVRVAPNELSFNTAQSWKDIYGFRQGHETFVKSGWYDSGSFSDKGVHSVITSRDVREHAQMRRYMSHAFSTASLRDQEGLVSEIVDELVEKMRHVGVRKDEPMDLELWLRMCTFDITGSLAFGESFDAVKNGGRHPSVRFIHEALKQYKVIDTMRRFPVFGKIFALFFAKALYRVIRGNKIHEEFCLKTVQKRMSNPSKRPDILTRLQESLESEETEISDVQIAVQVADLLQAGADTSNTTIATTLNFVLRDKTIYSRLTAEIRAKFSSYENINAQEAATITYLRTLILEALRIFPPVPFGLPRLAPKGGDTVDGYFIPEGTVVGTTALAACLSPQNFEEPYKFRPERWERRPNASIRGPNVLDASQPFILGPRGCMGQNLAWMEMNLIICKILWSFDLELMSVGTDIHRDSRVEVLWEKPPLLVRVKERTDMARSKAQV